MKKLLFIPLILLFLSCESNHTESTLDKTGSIEMVVSTKLLPDGRTILIINKNVWSNNTLSFSKTQYDTLQSLGTKKEIYTNSNGEEKEISVPKEYNVFITFD